MFPLRRTCRFPNRRDQTIPLKTKAHPFETDAPLFVLCPLPRGERSAVTMSSLARSSFQSTLPRGERRSILVRDLLLLTNFNPRSRVGSDISPWLDANPILYFNPRSRVGSDQSDTLVLVALLNFNPRSRVGSDVGGWVWASGDDNFNPRSRVGSDRRQSLRAAAPVHISIHAPAWGATRRRKYINIIITDFNPRSRVGSDKRNIPRFPSP